MGIRGLRRKSVGDAGLATPLRSSISPINGCKTGTARTFRFRISLGKTRIPAPNWLPLSVLKHCQLLLLLLLQIPECVVLFPLLPTLSWFIEVHPRDGSSTWLQSKKQFRAVSSSRCNASNFLSGLQRLLNRNILTFPPNNLCFCQIDQSAFPLTLGWSPRPSSPTSAGSIFLSPLI